ncbi:hypothetical protein FPV67DRAFT_1466731 [Lyophyllum atratum]|nr:hypothetical protein FPV67DRAFT_1466731 [Lyophyllum atratum]
MHHPESPLRKLLVHVKQHIQQSCIAVPATHLESCEEGSSDSTLLPPITTATSIASQLEAIGLSPVIARLASDKYLKAAHDLRDICQTSLRNAFRKASMKGSVTQEETQTMIQVWNAAYTQHTSAWVEEAFANARDAVAKAESTAAERLQKDKKPVFNHEYTPVLEKYFEYNAYPSAPDRAVLARKSMMTPRQIEVWFQNHRNRARKDGKPLRRLTEDPLPLEISLKSLERKMPLFTVPEHERKLATKSEPPRGDSSDDEDLPTMPIPARDLVAANPLNPPRPRHAFPTPYPPRCDYDPFPTKIGTHKFCAPVWDRKPSSTRPTLKAPIDLEDFIEVFQTKLHLRVPVSHKRRPGVSQSWCAARVTIPPPSPHPALVRLPILLPLKRSSPLATVRAPSSPLHPLQSFSPFSSPTTSMLPKQSNNIPARRKVASLPRRTPKNTSIAHRGSSAVSEASPAPLQSSLPASRSPSFGSDIASDLRTPSSSSCSSSSSSPLTTPEQSYTTLPGDLRSPVVSVSGLDCENTDHLFGDGRGTAALFNLPVTAHLKESFMFGFGGLSAGHMGS